jgi:hypothetical protein
VSLLVIILANAISLALYCLGRRVYRRANTWWHRWRRRNEPKDMQSSTIASLSWMLKSIYPAEGFSAERFREGRLYTPVRVRGAEDFAPQNDPGDEDMT